VKGDLISVVSEDPSGWWQGRNGRTGETGSFPCNYTSEVAAAAAPAAGMGALVISSAPAPAAAAPAAKDPFFFTPFA